MVRKTILASAVLIASTGAIGAAQAACKKAGPELAGVYELRGVREVGSLIQLRSDGRFAYMMTYGAYDEVARGCWSRNGARVVLRPTQMRTGTGGRKFKQLILTNAAAGLLLRKLDPRQTGRYIRVRRGG